MATAIYAGDAGYFKVCSKCGGVKSVSDFSKKSSSPDGYRTYCKPCGAKYTAEWHEANPDAIKIYRIEKADEIAAQRKQFREKNASKIASYQREWFSLNPTYFSDWDNENRQKRRGYVAKYHARRAKDDPAFRVSRAIRRGIARIISSQKAGRSWESLVGYTADQLREHLERQFKPGMSWDNYGEWHIDHIRPICSFNFASTNDPEFLECWGMKNLQPLWAKENLSKGGRYHPPETIAA